MSMKYIRKMSLIVVLFSALLMIACTKTEANKQIDSGKTPSNKVTAKDMPDKLPNVNKPYDFDDILSQYEDVWRDIQANYDNLKKSASMQPINAAQLASIKGQLTILQEDVALLDDINKQLQERINAIANPSEQLQKNIKQAQQISRAYNGKIKALYNSAGAYVNSIKAVE